VVRVYTLTHIIGISIKGTSKMTNPMDLEWRNSLMEIDTKVNSRMAIKVDREDSLGQTG
jgi:hypothetical protein